MAIRNTLPLFTVAKLKIAKKLALTMLIIHISLVVLTDISKIGDTIGQLLLPALLFCILAPAIGYYSAMLVGLDRDTRFTIGVEVGLQNVVLAIVIANVILKRPEFALFVVTYAIAGVLFVMLPWIYIHRRHGEHMASQSVATSSGSE